MYHLAVMNVPPYLLFCDLLTFNAVDPNRMDFFLYFCRWTSEISVHLRYNFKICTVSQVTELKQKCCTVSEFYHFSCCNFCRIVIYV